MSLVTHMARGAGLVRVDGDWIPEKCLLTEVCLFLHLRGDLGSASGSLGPLSWENIHVNSEQHTNGFQALLFLE